MDQKGRVAAFSNDILQLTLWAPAEPQGPLRFLGLFLWHCKDSFLDPSLALPYMADLSQA